MSADGDLGERSRSAETSCAAVRLPPPRSKKSSSGAGRPGAEDVGPELGQPGRGAGQSSAAGAVAVHAGQRPGQRVAVDLARRPGRQRRRRRRAAAPARPAGRRAARSAALAVEAGAGSSRVADQQLVAGRAVGAPRPRRRSTPASASRAASISPSSMRRPPSLTWSSARPDEDQALVVVPDQVAAAVGALPAQGRHRRVLLGVLGRVEVAGQPDAADDQLARPRRRRPRSPCASTTARSQPSSGSPIRTGPVAGEPGAARDHGRLGRAVGVPHLAAVGREPLGELGRAGLAAEDQQPHVVQRLRRPERRPASARWRRR